MEDRVLERLAAVEASIERIESNIAGDLGRLSAAAAEVTDLVRVARAGTHDLYDEQAVLCCPSCGGQYLHHKRVEVLERASEDRDGTRTVINGTSTVVSRREAAQMRGRRNSLFVSFSCEGCSEVGEYVLSLMQHKGHTFLHWNRVSAPIG